MSQKERSEAERELAETAQRVLPGGGFGNVSHHLVIAEGRGSHVWDVSGNEYIDYLLGSGPMFLGHAHLAVTKAAREALEDGTTFFETNDRAVLLAEEVKKAVRSSEMVRY